jgi:NAD(P)-dependent dehydrogenase (short-subunit alcohol dehydrogenase family)
VSRIGPLAGRTALVTGAGRGVGEVIAHVLAERGAAVAANDLHADRAEAVAREIAAGGGTAVAASFDLSDGAAIAAGVRWIEGRLGPVDVLVNNAGIPEGRRTVLFRDSSPEADWDPYVRLNVYGALSCIRAALPGMLERGWGHVIQISSGSGARGLPAGQSIYGGTKAFADSFVRHLAVEVARQGTTVNAVAPGAMGSIRYHLDAAEAEALAASVPVGRLGEGREIGSAVAWLASEEAGYVTGQVIHVNGGAYQGR